MSRRATSLAALLVACAGAQPSPDFTFKKAMLGELVRQRDYASATPLARDLHATAPDDAEVLLWRGLVLQATGLPEDAVADFEDAVRHSPELAPAHAALAVALDRQGRAEDALVHHQRAVELAPSDVEYHNNLGFSYFIRGLTNEAIETYLKALRLDPNNARVRNNLGFAYAKVGDLRSAHATFERAGSKAQAKNNLGLAYEQRGDVALAYDLYAEAVRLDPALPEARANLEHAAQVLGRPLPPEPLASPSVEGVTP